HSPETHLIPLAIQSALGEKQALEIYGTDYATRDHTAIRDYTHVMDLAEAHVAALRHMLKSQENAAINLGTGSGHSVRQVVAAVERVSGRRVPVHERRGVLATPLNSSPIQRKLGSFLAGGLDIPLWKTSYKLLG